MHSVIVTFHPEGTRIEARPGERILDVLSYAGLEIDNQCGGEGVCGKCRVKITRGRVNFSSKHLGFLTKKELEAGFVLACQTEILKEDIELWIPPESRREEIQILTQYDVSFDWVRYAPDSQQEQKEALTVDEILHYEAPGPLDEGPEISRVRTLRPLCRKYYLELPGPSLTDTLSDLDRIYRQLRKELNPSHVLRLQAHFSCLWGLAAKLRQSQWKVTATSSLRPSSFPIRRWNCSPRCKRALIGVENMSKGSPPASRMGRSPGEALKPDLPGNSIRQGRKPGAGIPDPLRVIFFDLGQTLVTAAAQSPRRMLASRLALSEKETRKVGRLIMTHPATEPAVLALALKEILFDRGQQPLETVIEEVWEEQRRCVRAIDGAASVLAALKEKGLALGLLSNTWHPLYSGFLRNCPEMAELFDHSVLSYRSGSKKPSPEIFRRALAEADAPAEHCWMIGDSYELDIEPALTAGMHTIWVLRSPEKEQQVLAQVLRGEKPCPDWSVARLDEVLECFSRKGLL